jgi:hypothetical protein
LSMLMLLQGWILDTGQCQLYFLASFDILDSGKEEESHDSNTVW